MERRLQRRRAWWQKQREFLLEDRSGPGSVLSATGPALDSGAQASTSAIAQLGAQPSNPA
jgi:hypothetical protein